MQIPGSLWRSTFMETSRRNGMPCRVCLAYSSSRRLKRRADQVSLPHEKASEFRRLFRVFLRRNLFCDELCVLFLCSCFPPSKRCKLFVLMAGTTGLEPATSAVTGRKKTVTY